ncbi:unnamed protein product [Owenia fusiformis]|nr:unnamed protein product [Owenia fusiformis]
MDVSSPQSIRRALGLIQYWLPKGKGLWSIVNNAGILGRPGFIDWLNVEDYKHVADVNLFGLIDVTNVFLPLVKKERGRVILMSSFLGRLSLPCSTPYAVTKYGVEAFADGLRFSMAPFGVSVHVLEPGFHKTNIGDTSVIKSNIKDSWERCSDDIRKQYGDSFIDKMTKVLDGPGALLVAHPKHVVNAYKHAIFGLFPKTRYVVGLDANILGVPLPYLPGAISDMLLTLFIPQPNCIISMVNSTH